MSSRVIVILLIILVGQSCLYQNPTAEAASIDEVNILALVSDGFGWNYFDIKDQFESWGVNFRTVAYTLDYEVDSCYNREPRPITADYLVSEMDNTTLSTFDCLIVPAGGHWTSLVGSQAVEDLILTAHDLGLVISAVCIGNVVIARAGDLLNGSKVAYYLRADQWVEYAGGESVRDSRVVSDNGFITGGTGGGYPNGFQIAPTYEVCAEIVREILGHSRVDECEVRPLEGTNETLFELIVTIENVSKSIPDVIYSEVNEVTARIYFASNRTFVEEIELLDYGYEILFSAFIPELEFGQYVIDIEVQDSSYLLEVIHNAASFSINHPTSSPSILDPALLIPLAVGIAAIAIIALVLVAIRKQIN